MQVVVVDLFYSPKRLAKQCFNFTVQVLHLKFECLSTAPEDSIQPVFMGLRTYGTVRILMVLVFLISFSSCLG